MKLKDNQFVATVSIPFPSHNRPLMQWHMEQNCGQKTLPLHIKCSKEHRDNDYTLHRGRLVKLIFEINKKGNWKLISAKL